MGIFQKIKEKLQRVCSQRGFTCDGCGREVFDYPVHRLCEDCEDSLSKNDGKRCPKCGRKTLAEGICLTCKRRMPKFAVGFSPFVYEGNTASFINRLKRGSAYLSFYFGEQMAKYLANGYSAMETYKAEGGEPLLVIPVPLTKEKLLVRGFNQAEELAKVTVEELSKMGYRTELWTEILEKTRETTEQKQASAIERADNVEGAYHVHLRKACQGRRILLIDDIMTTGATGNECAERLIGAGAKEVVFLTATALPEKK